MCDIGCGYGAPARLWADEYGASVTGFTVSQAQHAYAQRQPGEGTTPDIRLQDFLANDLPTASVDAAVAVESLTHMADPAGSMREVARVLRPGGRFAARVWMAASTPPDWARRHLLAPIRTEGRLSGLPTAAEVRRWADGVALTVEQLEDVTPSVRRTWTVLRRFVQALVTDPALLRFPLDATEAERVFARTLSRIWLAQHLGVLRYGWVVARRE